MQYLESILWFISWPVLIILTFILIEFFSKKSLGNEE